MSLQRDHSVVTFEAVLITRGGGSGAKRVMLENPEISELIKSFTGWNQVKAGTLTLDHASPLPLSVLAKVRHLAKAPSNLLVNPKTGDAQIWKRRGSPKYYAGIVYARSKHRRVILSQQPRPAVAHRLEVLADVCLRDVLSVRDGDRLNLAIFHEEDWEKLV